MTAATLTPPTATPQVGSGRLLPAPKRRLRRAWLILAALTIIAGALIAYWAGQRGQERVSVLAAAHALQPGHTLSRDDLRLVALADTTGLSTIDATAIEQVLGKQTSIAIPAGTLLSQDALRPVTYSPGDGVVGLSLTPAQLPSTPLVGGEQVELVPTPPQQGDPPTSQPASISAVVLSTSTVADSNATIVNVRLPKAQAVTAAAQAATGRIALVLVPQVNQ